MKLSEWLKEPGHKRTQDSLGRKVGLTQGRISQIAANGTTDLKTALAIQTATDFDVTVEDLLMPEKDSGNSPEPAPAGA